MKALESMLHPKGTIAWKRSDRAQKSVREWLFERERWDLSNDSLPDPPTDNKFSRPFKLLNWSLFEISRNLVIVLKFPKAEISISRGLFLISKSITLWLNFNPPRLVRDALP